MQDLNIVGEELRTRVDKKKVSLSLYSTRTAEFLAKDGSLFLWHLNLEGKVVFERTAWLVALFKLLKPYSGEKALRDVATFEKILDDVRNNLQAIESTYLFEATTTFAIVRNLGIIHSSLRGVPCFGRISPVIHLAKVMGNRFPFSDSDISRLNDLKLAYSRCPVEMFPDLHGAWCEEMALGAKRILDFVRGDI